MPTYVYECRTCGKVFEADQRITENALTDCECGATGSLRRLIQPISVAFKGAGFHINDYAPKGTPTDASESKTAESASTESSSTDSKPEESKPTESKPAETKQAAPPVPTTSESSSKPS